jgi:hypothetical protein
MQLLPPEVKDLANLGALALVAMLAVKWFFEYLGKKPDKSDTLSLKNGNGKAGEKSAEWWELAVARIVRQCLDDHENRVRRPASLEAEESRQQILERLRQLERQMALAVAEITRQIRDR